MALDERTTRSRRALLAGAVGGIVGLAAQALGRPAPVHAEGENIVVGGEYTTATSVTRLRNQTNSGTHAKGEIYMDSRGSLFICTADGTPGTWKKVVAKLV